MGALKNRAALAVIVGAALLTGCDGGGKQADTGVDVAATLGTWLEVRDEGSSNPRFVPQEPPTRSLRQLTLNEDGTFTFELVDSSGDPSGEGKTSGTWTASGGSIVFENTENTLKGDLTAIAPQRTPGPQTFVDPQSEKKLVRLRVFDESGALARFEKK